MCIRDRYQVVVLKHPHAQFLQPFFLFAGFGLLLKGFYVKMPVADEFFIAAQIRNIQPFADFHFCPVFFPAFMDLKEVAEGAVFIKPAQRETAADAGTEGMDGAAAFFI